MQDSPKVSGRPGSPSGPGPELGRCRSRDLLAGQLAVEAGESDSKSLQGAHGVVIVHGEDVFCHTAELHHNVVRCRGR